MIRGDPSYASVAEFHKFWLGYEVYQIGLRTYSEVIEVVAIE